MSDVSPSSTGPDDVFEWPGAHGRLSIRLYRGTARRSDGLLVFFPPGGFVLADLDASDDCLKAFAQTCQVNILAPSYAVAPAHPFPAAAEDAHAVLTQAAARSSHLRGWTGRHLLVGGIEAGGNLAAVCALMARDRHGPRLSGQILLMPMLDPSMSECARSPGQDSNPDVVQAMANAYRGYLPHAADRVHPYACPLQSSRIAGLPPALFVYAEGDPLAAEACSYADKLERGGVPVERVALPVGVLADAGARCAAAGHESSVSAIARFIASCLSFVPSSVSSSGNSL